MHFTIVDGVIIFVVLASTWLAYLRGFVREALTLVGWVVALFVAAQFAYLLVPYIESAPVVREYLQDSCELLTVLAFAIIFILTLVIMAILTPLFSGFVQNTGLTLVDKALGGIFGFVRGALMVLLVFILYDAFIQPSSPVKMIDQSRSYGIFTSPKENIRKNLPDQRTAPELLGDRFNELTSNCVARSSDVSS